MTIFRSFGFYFALAGLALALFLVRKNHAPDLESQPLALPAANPYQQTIAASGIVESVDKNISIGVPLSGLVQEVFVHVGQSVEKGQPLFQLDDRELQAQLVVQQAQVQVAEATLKRIEDQLQRLSKIEDKRAISQEEIQTKSHDVKVAQAQLKAAQAQVEQAKRLIDRLIVKAPIQGVVLQNNIRVGEYILNSAAPAIVLGNLDRLQVRADIDEQNASYMVASLKATGFPKNNTSLAIPLSFERIEPFVIPKKSLTGASDERVDTRVLQVIYSFEKPAHFPLYVGQQVDIFIEKEPFDSQETAEKDKKIL